MKYIRVYLKAFIGFAMLVAVIHYCSRDVPKDYFAKKQKEAEELKEYIELSQFESDSLSVND